MYWFSYHTVAGALYMRSEFDPSSLVNVMDCLLIGAKPLPQSMMKNVVSNNVFENLVRRIATILFLP